MRPNIKPPRDRKPYCRKTGGGSFRFTQKVIAPIARSKPKQATESQQTVVKGLLQKMGFRTGPR